MNDFLLDVWSDLRSKKLVPVLVLLAVALIAVPVFLLDSSSADEAAVTPPVATPQGATAAASAVSLQETASQRSSRLDVFGKEDPFRRPAKRKTGGGSAVTDALTGAMAAAEGGGASADATAAGGGESGIFASDSAIGASVANGNLPGDNGDASAPGSSGSAPSPGGGSSSPGSSKAPIPSSTPGTSSPMTSRPGPVKAYAYRLDLRFGTTGQVNTLKDVKRLTPLPSDRRPYVVFLGVEEDGKTAVFLVDTNRVQPSGSEGECKPSPSDCSLLYLRDTPDADQHTFLDRDGNRYGLTLTDIHMDEIGSTTKGSKAKSAKSARVKAAQRDKPTKAERRNGFSFPEFFELFRSGR